MEKINKTEAEASKQPAVQARQQTAERQTTQLFSRKLASLRKALRRFSFVFKKME